MNIRQLQYFQHLARTQHYRKTAEELFVSQPALSQAISSLEEELGVLLFERKGRNVLLSEAGKVYLEYVDEALEILKNGEKKLEETKDPEHGEVSFSFIFNLGTAFVPQLFYSYSKDHPNSKLQFSCRAGQSIEVIKQLKTRQIDFAISTYNAMEKDLEFQSILSQEIVFIAPNHHEILERGEVEFEEIVKYPLITYNRDTFIRHLADERFVRLKLHPIYEAEMGFDMGMISMVAANQGIGIIPKEAIRGNAHVKVIHTKEKFAIQEVYVVTNKGQQLSRGTRTFIEYIGDFANSYK